MTERQDRAAVNGFDAQRACLKGRWLVEASAGTGKTYALERIVLRLIIEEGVAIDRILVVTFTNAATAELRERVRSLLHKTAEALGHEDEGEEFVSFFEKCRARGLNPKELIENALERFDEASILTIHGFCQKMLSEFIFTRGGAYDVEFASDTGFENQVTEEFLRNELPKLTAEQRQRVLKWKSLPQLLRKLCEHGCSVRPEVWAGDEQLNDPALLALFKRFLSEAPERVRELERLHAVKSFSALLTDMYVLVDKDEAACERIRMRYDAVLVDEFQDTDRVQYQIFKRLFLIDSPQAPKSVFFVGDPKQAIYAFRGAELDVYLRARQDIESMKIQGEGGLRTLETNYRSTPALVAAVNAFFSAEGQDGSFLTPDIRYAPLESGASAKPLIRICGGKPQIVPVMSLWIDDGRLSGYSMEAVKQTEARFMADDIASLLDGTVYLYRGGHWRLLVPSDIAILVRSRSSSDYVRRELLKRGVRTLLDDRASVFATAQAQDVLTVFEAMQSPTDAKKFAAARATRLIGRSIRELREDLAAAGADRLLLKTALERFQAYGPAAALAYIGKQRNIQQRLLPVKGGAAMLMNYEHLSELLQEQYCQLGTLAAVKRAMVRLKNADQVEDKHVVRKPNDENVVRIVTVHASKGLEYPVVYLAQAEGMKAKTKDNETFWLSGDADSCRVSVAPEQRDDDTQQAGRFNKLERLRQVYVAMTRASSRLVLPIFVAAGGRQWSWMSACNAYAQAMSGVSEPAGRSTDYMEVIGTLRTQAEKMLDRFARIALEKPDVLDVSGVNETLARDLPERLGQRLENDSAAAFVELKACTDSAEAVRSVASNSVQALQPVSVRAAWHRSSFTAIAASLGASAGEEFEAEEFEGENALVEPNEEAEAPSSVLAGQTEINQPLEGYTGLQEDESAVCAAKRLLRGAAAGDWIHKLFERVMNAEVCCRDDILSQVKTHLAASALLSRADPTQREAVLEAGAALIENYVRNTIECDFFTAETVAVNGDALKAKPFVLNSLEYGQKLCEMPFLLSVTNKTVSARDVARCMTENGFPMENLRDSALDGYLTGAIDMVFTAAGKFFILDWKSNWLGSDVQDYSQEAMIAEITRKHYSLQYVIYLVALKRHLMATMAMNEENVWDVIGGAFYVFVRGIDAQQGLDARGRRNGIFFDCPRQAVDALDALLKGDDGDG